jgi:hypothetical protein
MLEGKRSTNLIWRRRFASTLSSVLPDLSEFPVKRVSELTPANWGRRST